ncbi:hypothetical protein PC116_g28156 [Phytophthora cactorum]|nr:hypothetical protein PC116_g28156 [Phytophthora cactorum]
MGEPQRAAQQRRRQVEELDASKTETSSNAWRAVALAITS